MAGQLLICFGSGVLPNREVLSCVCVSREQGKAIQYYTWKLIFLGKVTALGVLCCFALLFA